jgi:hypothetical protein
MVVKFRNDLLNLGKVFLDLIICVFCRMGVIGDGVKILLIILIYIFLNDFLVVIYYLKALIILHQQWLIRLVSLVFSLFLSLNLLLHLE